MELEDIKQGFYLHEKTDVLYRVFISEKGEYMVREGFFTAGPPFALNKKSEWLVRDFRRIESPLEYAEQLGREGEEHANIAIVKRTQAEWLKRELGRLEKIASVQA